MEQYNVTGMSCAACSARVEKAVNVVPGVSSCSVNLLTNSMVVEGTASSKEVIEAVKHAGYGADLKSNNKVQNNSVQENELKDTETPKLTKRLCLSVFFWLILMYFSMGHMMWNWPIPKAMSGNHIAMGLLQMLLTIIVMIINQKFFVSGYKSLFRGAPNMDTLVALGSSAAFIYSTAMLFLMTDAVVTGNHQLVMHYMDEFYFESAATILTLITVGKTLESYSKGKTTDAIKGLMKLAPKTAIIKTNDGEKTVSIDQVKIDDIFIVHPGESVPVDGIVVKGVSAVDESALTGESIPVDKVEGDEVSAATINQSGYLECKATRVGEDTTLSQIIKMVSEASATKAPIAKVADKVSGVFVPIVMIIALLTTAIWLLINKDVGYALARGISVLVISCPCALGLATPVAIMVGNGAAAKNGIMFKTAVSLEAASKAQIVVLDKTGTITTGKPVVTDIVTKDNKKLMEYAYALEIKSEHPLAKAIVDYAKEKKITLLDCYDFNAVIGNGLTGKLDGDIWVFGGNQKYIEKVVSLSREDEETAKALAEEGKTPIFFASKKADLNAEFIGIIAVADVIKSDAKTAIATLKNIGTSVVMLTGDNERTANAISKVAGVDEVIAEVLPNEKENIVSELQKIGKVLMVGDGINDAPALTRADTSIAIGAGTDIAIDAADIVLMKDKLMDVPKAILLSKKTLKNIYENLFWAFIYNIIGIPLAAGIWIPVFGWELNPMFGAAAMSLSSFCVVSNALRLNFIKFDYDKYKKKSNSVSKEKTIEMIQKMKYNEKKKREVQKMTKTITIKGMMCGHCEMTVKKALEALEQVAEAKVSHDEGTAVVTLNAEVTDDVLKETVEAKDFEVVSIQ